MTQLTKDDVQWFVMVRWTEDQEEEYATPESKDLNYNDAVDLLQYMAQEAEALFNEECIFTMDCTHPSFTDTEDVIFDTTYWQFYCGFDGGYRMCSFSFLPPGSHGYSDSYEWTRKQLIDVYEAFCIHPIRIGI
jgi:hypothetical protein